MKVFSYSYSNSYLRIYSLTQLGIVHKKNKNSVIGHTSKRKLILLNDAILVCSIHESGMLSSKEVLNIKVFTHPLTYLLTYLLTHLLIHVANHKFRKNSNIKSVSFIWKGE